MNLNPFWPENSGKNVEIKDSIVPFHPLFLSEPVFLENKYVDKEDPSLLLFIPFPFERILDSTVKSGTFVNGGYFTHPILKFCLWRFTVIVKDIIFLLKHFLLGLCFKICYILWYFC
jgi:hypothetical protein